MPDDDKLIVTDSLQIADPLKKYYVYALIDDREISEKGIFYIGKGTSRRALQHGADALRFENLEITDEDNIKSSAKINKIKEIRDAGGEPLVRVLARFDTENEAFAAEAILIQAIYGRLEDGGQLTNIVLGHNSKYIRDKGVFEELPRLDIPKNTRLDNGEYSKNALDKLIKFRVQDKADEAVTNLRLIVAQNQNLHNKVKIFDPQIVESGRYVASIVNFGENDVVIRLQFSSKGLITNLRAAEENTKMGRSKFSSRLNAVGLQALNRGSYGWINGWKNNSLDFNDYNGMLCRIHEAYKLFR